MNETLGRRIAAARKARGMTQDQLAEKLGLTAQAVSKWENDQSCPDITLLPRLAALLGMTVDQLLGADQEPVHQGEVVQDPAAAQKNRKWDWSYDMEDVSGERTDAVAFALMILVCGVLMLVRSICHLEYSFWDILWPCGLLFVGLAGMCKKFSFVSAGFTLFGGIFLAENTGLLQLDVDSGWIFPILLILFGLSLLPHAFKKKKPHFTFTYNSDGHEDQKHQPITSYDQEDGIFDCSGSFGEFRHLVETDLLKGGDASVSFGELTLDLTGCAAAEPNCLVEVDCSFGEATLLVPPHLRLIPDKSIAFGNIDISGTPNPDATPVRLDANVSFGEICIRYL